MVYFNFLNPVEVLTSQVASSSYSASSRIKIRSSKLRHLKRCKKRLNSLISALRFSKIAFLALTRVKRSRLLFTTKELSLPRNPRGVQRKINNTPLTPRVKPLIGLRAAVRALPRSLNSLTERWSRPTNAILSCLCWTFQQLSDKQIWNRTRSLIDSTVWSRSKRWNRIWGSIRRVLKSKF